jgi:hypothetical protein
MLVIADGLPRGLGYLEVDNRQAGDLPPGVARHFEADTYTCTHCSTVVVMNPQRVRERYKCRGCSHHICDPCAAKRAAGEGCKTMAQLFDEEMAKAGRQAEASVLILP